MKNPAIDFQRRELELFRLKKQIEEIKKQLKPFENEFRKAGGNEENCCIECFFRENSKWWKLDEKFQALSIAFKNLEEKLKKGPGCSC